MIYFWDEFSYKSSVINHWLRSVIFTREDAFREKKTNPKELKIKYSFLQRYNPGRNIFHPVKCASPRGKRLTCSDFSRSFFSVCKNWQFSFASFWTSSIRPMSSLSWSLHITPALRVGEKAKIYLNPQSQDMTPLQSSPYNKHIFSVSWIKSWSW